MVKEIKVINNRKKIKVFLEYKYGILSVYKSKELLFQKKIDIETFTLMMNFFNYNNNIFTLSFVVNFIFCFDKISILRITNKIN